jgi:hypothetical protein
MNHSSERDKLAKIYHSYNDICKTTDTASPEKVCYYYLIKTFNQKRIIKKSVINSTFYFADLLILEGGRSCREIE